MYIIEKIIKAYFKLKNKNNIVPNYAPNEEEELEDVITCKHNFMPIDSSGNILACSKCGYVVTKNRLKKNHNFFKYQ